MVSSFSLSREYSSRGLDSCSFADEFRPSFVANLIATVFMLLNLNAVMSIIFNVPAAIASTIVASRAVRRLTEFTGRGPEVFSTRCDKLLRFEEMFH